MRNLASEDVLVSEPVLPESDRDDWMSWAEKNLKQTQTDLDLADTHPDRIELWKELSNLANSWVEFYGYARQGRSQEMARSLRDIRHYQDSAQSLACQKITR